MGDAPLSRETVVCPRDRVRLRRSPELPALFCPKCQTWWDDPPTLGELKADLARAERADQPIRVTVVDLRAAGAIDLGFERQADGSMRRPDQPPAGGQDGTSYRCGVCGRPNTAGIDCCKPTGASVPETDTLARLQREQVPWVKHNFGDRPAWMPLLGAQEELGELAHAHLKAVQGIRTGEDHAAAKADALADIVIYLADYASAEGIDLRAVVAETWDRVKQRDWKADPVNGASVPEKLSHFEQEFYADVPGQLATSKPKAAPSALPSIYTHKDILRCTDCGHEQPFRGLACEKCDHPIWLDKPQTQPASDPRCPSCGGTGIGIQGLCKRCGGHGGVTEANAPAPEPGKRALSVEEFGRITQSIITQARGRRQGFHPGSRIYRGLTEMWDNATRAYDAYLTLARECDRLRTTLDGECKLTRRLFNEKLDLEVERDRMRDELSAAVKRAEIAEAIERGPEGGEGWWVNAEQVRKARRQSFPEFPDDRVYLSARDIGIPANVLDPKAKEEARDGE